MHQSALNGPKYDPFDLKVKQHNFVEESWEENTNTMSTMDLGTVVPTDHSVVRQMRIGPTARYSDDRLMSLFHPQPSHVIKFINAKAYDLVLCGLLYFMFWFFLLDSNIWRGVQPLTCASLSNDILNRVVTETLQSTTVAGEQ